MIVLWVSCVAGAAVIAFLAAGWVSWVAFAAAAVVGLVVGVPAGIWTARRIKVDDPNWPPYRRRNGAPR